MVQAVLRGIPKASTCSSSVWSPISLAASASCLIFADCAALISDGHISCTCLSFSICRWKRRSRSLGIAVHAPKEPARGEGFDACLSRCPFVSLVALLTWRDLLFCAKHLFVAACRGLKDEQCDLSAPEF